MTTYSDLSSSDSSSSASSSSSDSSTSMVNYDKKILFAYPPHPQSYPYPALRMLITRFKKNVKTECEAPPTKLRRISMEAEEPMQEIFEENMPADRQSPKKKNKTSSQGVRRFATVNSTKKLSSGHGAPSKKLEKTTIKVEKFPKMSETDKLTFKKRDASIKKKQLEGFENVLNDEYEMHKGFKNSLAWVMENYKINASS